MLTVSGANAVSVFYVTGNASMSGLRIANGSCAFACGLRSDGVFVGTDLNVDQNTAATTGGTSGFAEAGGIFNGGTMTLTSSRVTGNSAVSTGATNQNSPAGGGIYNNGGATLTIDRSTVSGNSVTATAPAGATSNVNGGGIDNVGTLNLIRSTVSGNTAHASGSATFNSASGGGIGNANSAAVHVVIDRSTIASNTVTTAGAGVHNPQAGGVNALGGVGSFAVTSSTISSNSAAVGANVVVMPVATFKNTIVANPQGGGLNCSGSGATSQGFNLTDGTGCGFDQATDKLSTDPQLDPSGLADNGGPTRTIVPVSGSPAIDAGHASAGETVDQRGNDRPYDFAGVSNGSGGDASDIGAVEVQGPPETTITSGPSDGALIATPTPAFEFSSSVPGSSFECSLDGGGFTTCSSPFTTAQLGDGPRKVAVRAVNTSQVPDPTPATRSFTVDTTAPNPVILSGPSGLTSDSTPTFAFSADDADAQFLCSIDGVAAVPCSGPGSSETTLTLADGAHVFTLGATDAAGNSATTSRSFRVDATAPETKITKKPKKGRKPKFSFKGNEGEVTFECRLDKGEFVPCGSPLKLKHVKPGKHVLRVRAVDAAGNVDATPARQKFARRGRR